MTKTEGKTLEMVDKSNSSEKTYQLKANKLVRSYLKSVIKNRLWQKTIPKPPIEMKNRCWKTYLEVMSYGPIEWAKKHPDFHTIFEQTVREIYPVSNKKKKDPKTKRKPKDKVSNNQSKQVKKKSSFRAKLRKLTLEELKYKPDRSGLKRRNLNSFVFQGRWGAQPVGARFVSNGAGPGTGKKR